MGMAVESTQVVYMESSDQVLEKINMAAERLSPARKMELLDYVEYLLIKELRTKNSLPQQPAGDPLLQFIGGVSVGHLASSIDEDLYG